MCKQENCVDDVHHHHHARTSMSPSLLRHRSILRPARKTWTLIRLGKLHVGVHGLLGVSSLVWTSAAAKLYYQHGEETPTAVDAATLPPLWLVLAASQVGNAVLVHHARTLLPQVPAFTQIAPGVVAPHREAFRRTIAAVQYLLARVLVRWIRNHAIQQQPQLNRQQQQMESGTIDDHESPSQQTPPQWWIDFALLAILVWRWLPLVPNCCNLEWLANGNTWIFVVPIFVGVTGDLYQYVQWGDCVSTAHLLAGQLLGLCLAFGFTLAFRNYVPMPAVYFLAALSVWRVIQEGIATIQVCDIRVNHR